jgi:uncharacterized membrane protein
MDEQNEMQNQTTPVPLNARSWARYTHTALGVAMVLESMLNPKKSLWNSLTNLFGWVYIAYGVTGSEPILNALGCTTASDEVIQKPMNAIKQMSGQVQKNSQEFAAASV